MVHHGDCLEVMSTMDENSIDAIVTDPPYGLSFMGKGWDHGVPGEHFWREAIRVAKPGAHLLAFGGTRTFHRLAVAIEDAGWEIRDTVMWVYGSGFPKSHNLGKAIDKERGNEREDLGAHPNARDTVGNIQICKKNGSGRLTRVTSEWEGWGTALKPAWEPIIVARKPLDGTVAENVQKWGTGAINIDGCRVGTDGGTTRGANGSNAGRPRNTLHSGNFGVENIGSGRWPANLIHDGSEEVLELFPVTKERGNRSASTSSGKRRDVDDYGLGSVSCGADRNHGIPGDSGSAARFFYCAKASKRDRDEGCEGLGDSYLRRPWAQMEGRVDAGKQISSFPSKNNHPTVKPTDLMRYLCRLVTPPNGLVLDPFCGSGSTGKAAILEGFRFVGIEKEAEYVEIANRRIDSATTKEA